MLQTMSRGNAQWEVNMKPSEKIRITMPEVGPYHHSNGPGVVENMTVLFTCFTF